MIPPRSCDPDILWSTRSHVKHSAKKFDDLADVETLPPHHEDPFDRLLVVQAKRQNLEIISPDEIFESYGVKRVW